MTASHAKSEHAFTCVGLSLYQMLHDQFHYPYQPKNDVQLGEMRIIFQQQIVLCEIPQVILQQI